MGPGFRGDDDQGHLLFREVSDARGLTPTRRAAGRTPAVSRPSQEGESGNPRVTSRQVFEVSRKAFSLVPFLLGQQKK